jgi:hypothetical protein
VNSRPRRAIEMTPTKSMSDPPAIRARIGSAMPHTISSCAVLGRR